jgi:hypothetical protein
MMTSGWGASMAAPRPWKGACGDEFGRILGRSAQRGKHREHGEPEYEHPPLPEDVARPAHGDQQRSEDKQVGVADPEHLVESGVQGVDQAGHRDVDDRGVHQDGERSHAQYGQGPPLPAAS